MKGAERFQALLDTFGGTVSTEWVCDYLGASEDAVCKRVQQRSLLARKMPTGELHFPRFQFDESTGGLVPEIQPFLSHLNSWSVEEIVRFLLVRHSPSIVSVSNETPLDMLKNDQLDQVIALADKHLTQRP